MQILKYINLTLAFLLELGMFAAIGCWGYRQGTTVVSKYAIGITLVLLASVLWGILAAPKSKNRLPFVQRLVFELAMFFTASFLLYQCNQPLTAAGFAILACITIALSFIWKQ